MESLVLSVKGLYTAFNEDSSVPVGALTIADNIVVSKDGIAEPRRGLNRLAFTLPLSTDRAIKLLQYQNTLLVHYRNTQLGYYSSATGVVPYTGSYSSPDPNLALIKYAEANQNLYFTSTKGVQKLDKFNGNPSQAGMYKGLDCQATASTNPAGFMQNQSQVAYRLLWGITDANNNLVLGFPSQRAVIANQSNQNQNVSVVTTIPAGVTVDHFYQLYRSDQALANYVNAFGTIQDLTYTATAAHAGTPGNFITVKYVASFATLAIGDLTYTAVANGSAGNLVSVAYTGGGTAGAEVVTVTGSAISVQIQSGVSTTTQIKTAINGSAAALALVTVTGGSAATQTTASAQFLSGGIAPGAEVVTVTSSTLTVGALTYTSVLGGGLGQQVTIAYTSGGTAGSEVVTVTGNAISVQIQSGTSTDNQIKTAINASAAALALVSVSGSGTGTETTMAASPLTGGFVQVKIDSSNSTATNIFAAINANSSANSIVAPSITGVATNTQTAPSSVVLSGGSATLVTPDDNMQLVYEGSPSGSTLVLQDLTYTSVLAGTLANNVYVGYITGGTAGSEVVNILPSSLIVQDITYASVALGGLGNLVSITYTGGAVAGSEVVTVTGNAISVQIQSGVSTASQILSAVNASAAALNIVSGSITGAGSNTQTTAGATSLSGGQVQVKIASGTSTATQIVTAVNASRAALALVSVKVSGTGSNTQTAPSGPTALSGGTATLTILDQVPDSLRGAALYTNSNQEGILQSNELPPYANDLATFRNCLFFGNTRTKQILQFSILSAGGSSGIQLADTITIAGTTYTAASSENISSNDFQLVTSGSAAQNINDTALSLVRVINQNTSNTTVYAYYVSTPTGLPGQIQIEERILGGAAYAATVSGHGGAYSPTLPTSGTAVSSTNQVNLNGLMYSKQQRPDAVPGTNILFAGSASKKILRILALRDSLFILKEDGIFRCTGADPTSFSIDLLDNTAILLAPESAVTLSNQIYALTTQGIVAISDTGVQVMSRPIEDQLVSLFGSALTPLQYYSFGIGYESDREYILWTVSQSSDTTATQAFVYNIFTKAWTRWTRTQGPGVVFAADNKLYLTDPTTNYINQERKNGDYTDYTDESLAVTIVSASGNTVVVNDAGSAAIGDILYQSTSVASLITAVNITTNTITVADPNTVAPWNPSNPAFIDKAIRCLVEWTPNSANNQPGYLKQWSEAALQFKKNSFTNGSFNFYSEISTGIDVVPIIGGGNGTWGRFQWGLIPWGGSASRKLDRTYIPLEKQRCGLLSVQFSCQEAWASFALEGLALSFRYISSRTSI